MANPEWPPKGNSKLWLPEHCYIAVQCQQLCEGQQNTIETSINDQNTPKLSQNALDFLDFGMDEVIFLIISEVWGISIICKVSRFDCSCQLFQGYFCHFIGFGLILVVSEILRLFLSIMRFRWGFLIMPHYVSFLPDAKFKIPTKQQKNSKF